MKAPQGIAYHQAELIYLPGNVVIEREGTQELAPYYIETRELVLKIPDAFASTAKEVSIKSAEQWTTAVGLQAWLNEPPRLKLLHQVRGHYDFK
jgi:lipopolysaccharide export system protein LptC